MCGTKKKKRTPKEDLDRRSASSHDSKKCAARSVEQQRGMAFGFRKTATVVITPDGRTDRQTDRQMCGSKYSSLGVPCEYQWRLIRQIIENLEATNTAVIQILRSLITVKDMHIYILYRR
jgi:hypothetical protein